MAIPPRTAQEVSANNLYQYQRYLLLMQKELEEELKRVDEHIKFTKSDEGRKLECAVFRPSKCLLDYWRYAEALWQRLFTFSEVEQWRKGK